MNPKDCTLIVRLREQGKDLPETNGFLCEGVGDEEDFTMLCDRCVNCDCCFDDLYDDLC